MTVSVLYEGPAAIGAVARRSIRLPDIVTRDRVVTAPELCDEERRAVLDGAGTGAAGGRVGNPIAGSGRRWDVKRTHLAPETDDMWNQTRPALAALALALASATAGAAQGNGDMAMNDQTTMVGGQAMFRTRDIVDNAMNSADHTTLVAAVKAAGLVETLKGSGPFTVFAPTNAASPRC
jgi:hypothetical protein